MIGSHRLRRFAPLGVAAVLALALAACAQSYPNTTFTPHTDLGRSIDFLWDRLMLFGTIMFVLVEGLLLYVVIRYRRKSEDVMPPQTHGNVILEVSWTLIPAAILAFIAVPSVRTIFETEAPAPANSLVIEVTGHQWWWEFRYPEYKITTANEIYIPKGRTVDFVLRSQDVIHSFWVPQLAGKRDVIPNHTNHIWFTPDTNVATTVWNGFCAEYCGDSHGEMHFRVVTVTPEQFASWVTREQAPGFFAPPPAAVAAVPPAAAGAAVGAATTATSAPPPTPVPATPTATPAQLAAYILPQAEIPEYAIPHTPFPASIKFDDKLTGDPAAGEKLFVGAGTCNACHAVMGNPLAVGMIGPNLTHVGSRMTIAAGMYMNDKAHLSRWIKDARVMKSGVLMPTLGKGQYDPQTKSTNAAGLTDQQIADLVAYLQALK
ncbi:MAG: cytochrome c oxidase subunit II [Gemmatimonadaceae bacterium]